MLGQLQTDNDSEVISRTLDQWAYENGMTMDFSRPGKPTDNARIESFNSSDQDECLSVHWFLSLEDAQENTSTGDMNTTGTGRIHR
ncbi:integrase core domain-containing protein [Dickeya dianthicola]|uniref:integrase core domain-containing protein n=1 Tax=Dickeya dianthicola TaxID=204039 RepID=UPI0003A9AF81